MDAYRIQRLTGGTWEVCTLSGGYDPHTSAGPSAVLVVKHNVTIEGFTIRSTYIGDPGQTWHPNTGAVLIGGVAAGDIFVDGVSGTTVRNCVLSGWSAVYNWKSSDTTLQGNTMTNIPVTTVPMGSTVSVWDGWIQGSPQRSTTRMHILNNQINSLPGSFAVAFGGITGLWTGVDHSNLYIDGNTINSGATGVDFWGSLGTNKVMTCNNVVTVPEGSKRVDVRWGTYDGPYASDSDGDGVEDCLDACPGTGQGGNVVIDGCDTGVGNQLLRGGCSFSQKIASCAANAANHGGFVTCVAQLTNEWVAAGLITGSQKGAIQKCAAKADIP